MLSNNLAQAETRAREVIVAAEAAGRPQVREHATFVVDRVIPDARHSREAIVTFIDLARERLEETLRVHNVDHARGAFGDLVSQLNRLIADVSHAAADAGLTRAHINVDLAEAAVELARLRALVVRRVAEADQARQKAIDKALESSLVWLGGPLAKLIQEAVSLARDGTLSEHVSINAIRDLERAQDDASRYQSSIVGLEQLNRTAEDVASSLQGLLNILALTSGHLRNASEDIGEAGQIELFCHTALLDLENLATDVA